MPLPKNITLAEYVDYEGYSFKETSENKDDLASQMCRLATGGLELMQYVKPSRRTLGAKAYRAYMEQKRILAGQRRRVKLARQKKALKQARVNDAGRRIGGHETPVPLEKE
jgi:hypothetical protein